MAFGIDTLTNLNNADFDWSNFYEWRGLWPEFVGRYFGPSNGSGLAVSGEFKSFYGTTGNACKYVVPICSPFQSRETETGTTGYDDGVSDANDTIKLINDFLNSGELAIPSSGEIYVYLDVEANTAISPAYWSGYANTIYLAKDAGGAQIFFPAIYTQFVQNSSGKYVPQTSVVNTLTDACKDWPDAYVRCFGFWPNEPENPASTYCVAKPGTLDFGVFGTFSQNLCASGSADVPVLLWQYADPCVCLPAGYSSYAGLGNATIYCGSTPYQNNNIDMDGSDSTGAESYMMTITGN